MNNNWKESDWFKNWLLLARHGENAPNRAEDPAGGLTLHDRNITPAAATAQLTHSEEWHTAE